MIDQVLFNLIRYWRWLKSRSHIRRNLIFISFLALSIFITYKTVGQIDRNYELEQEVVKQQQLIKNLSSKIDAAQKKVDYLSSAYYSSWATSRKIGFKVKPGESVLNP